VSLACVWKCEGMHISMRMRMSEVSVFGCTTCTMIPTICELMMLWYVVIPCLAILFCPDSNRVLLTWLVFVLLSEGLSWVLMNVFSLPDFSHQQHLLYSRLVPTCITSSPLVYCTVSYNTVPYFILLIRALLLLAQRNPPNPTWLDLTGLDLTWTNPTWVNLI
jgi:hypothetical protein